jgi:hypothetical protein
MGPSRTIAVSRDGAATVRSLPSRMVVPNNADREKESKDAHR